jgi:hypothetical protein
MQQPKTNVLLEAENIAAGKIIHKIDMDKMTLKDFEEANRLAKFMQELEDEGVNFNL